MSLLNRIKSKVVLIGIVSLIASCTSTVDENIGNTVITKWQGDKKSAISITYDDGIINQMTVARPIMNKLNIPATFYVITGKVKGSEKGKFIGRPNDEIIKETESIKTNSENFFERASLIGYTGTTEALIYHTNAGSLFESGNKTEAYALIDEGYEKIRSGEMKNTDDVVFHNNAVDTTTWEQYKSYAAEGHEIASHSVTHPRLAALDEVNLLYELEQSKTDIQKFMGEEYTFSAECPFGTENERVMDYAHKIYPSLRNRMPEDYLDELNRSSKKQPGESVKEYVQWQRGPRTHTSMDEMKSWVDTCIVNDNIWLVLVFHGIDGIGWESKTGAELEEYFSYMNEKEVHLWIATFADVTKYIRERKNAEVTSISQGKSIVINVSSSLDPAVYNVPITLKTYVPSSWKGVTFSTDVIQEKQQGIKIKQDKEGSYILYSIVPDKLNNEIVLTEKI